MILFSPFFSCDDYQKADEKIKWCTELKGTELQRKASHPFYASCQRNLSVCTVRNLTIVRSGMLSFKMQGWNAAIQKIVKTSRRRIRASYQLHSLFARTVPSIGASSALHNAVGSARITSINACKLISIRCRGGLRSCTASVRDPRLEKKVNEEEIEVHSGNFSCTSKQNDSSRKGLQKIWSRE